jgi:UDP-N-acetylmuramate--alanine ligase
VKTRAPSDVGRGLAPARAARAIARGERIHVIGAAGAGASAALLLAHHAGAAATGCDPGGSSPYTAAAEALQLGLAWRHDPAHVAVDGAPRVDRVGVTKALTAVDPDHAELAAAREAGVPVEAWQQIVADAAATRGSRLVAVAGTHGKSTSAGWLVHVLALAGRDPSAFVGALMRDEDGLTATARWGDGPDFVVEADEYAGNFDAYRPTVALLLDAEWDHPDVFPDEEAVLEAFARWLRAAQPEVVVANTGDPGASRILERLADLPGRLLTYRLATPGAPEEDVAGEDEVRGSLEGGVLRILPVGGPEVAIPLQLPGRHNAANALGVAATARALGLDWHEIAPGLAGFRGVGRRLELKGEPAGVTVLDDYGHHPTAIGATLEAVRERYPGRRVWAVYEPLTYHRTAWMLDAFADVLATADRAVIADIWAGRDPDTTSVSAADLAGAVTARAPEPATAPGSVESTADHLAGRVERGDVVLVMGGGRSYVIAERLVELLAAR